MHFQNIEILKIFNLCNTVQISGGKFPMDKFHLEEHTYGPYFMSHVTDYDNSDHNIIKYIAQTCARNLPKLKLLHYCSKYRSTKPMRHNLEKYNFKINYFNTKDCNNLKYLIIGNNHHF